MDAGRPGDERLRVEVRAAALVGVHYRLQSRVSVYGRPGVFFYCHEEAEGRPASSRSGSKDQVYATQRATSGGS